MSDIKFSCPQCGQHITCDELCMGMQVACPGCQQTLTVPQMAPGPPQQRIMPVYQSVVPEEKSGGVKKIVIYAVIVIALAVGGYFGFTWLVQMQRKANEKMAEEAKNSSGGEMGETAAIYKTLDATDPDKMHTPSYGDLPGTRLARRAANDHNAATADAEDDTEDAVSAKTPGNDLPVIAPAYTLDATSATIPDGRVNGVITGSPFVADIIRFDAAQGYQALRFTQGNLISPDREVLVYFHFKPGEGPAGTIVVTPDSHAAGTPSVTKRWKTDPKYAPQSKSFTTGYVMKVEFTGVTAGVLSGKIYLALPDAEKTVVAGVFKARMGN